MNDFNDRASIYANRLRVRVCGICLQDNKVLAVRHQATVKNQEFWAPPGGGLEYNERMRDCLAREFTEETGVEIEVGRFLYVNEFMQEPLHAVELFFEVQPKGGNLKTGTDPEAAADQQLIEEVRFISLPELRQIAEADKHRIFHNLTSLDDLLMPQHRILPESKKSSISQ